MDPEPTAQGGEVQVTVTFTTKLPASLRVPPGPVTVPGNLTRYGLSQIINHLLGLDPPRPFDFLIKDELLRLSLHRHMAARELTTEAVLEVEYVPAVLPPTPKEQHPHDDWVSAITSAPGPALFASGAYDGVVRLWGAEAGAPTASFAAHKGAVKAVAGNASQMVTGGEDCVARVWRWGAKGAAPALVAVLKGHSGAVRAAAVSPDGDRVATGGWDGATLLFRGGDALEEAAAEGDAAAPTKRAKRGAAGSAVPVGGFEEESLASLTPPGASKTSSSTYCVSALAWPTEAALVSGCWDHAVRVWDPEVGAVLDSYAHNKAVNAVAAAPGGSADVIAFGGADKALRVWDRRAGDELAVKTLSSHTEWISALAWHPFSAHHIASASYDGSTKLWDLRATVPLATLPPVSEKLLAVGWSRDGGVLAYGGADSVVHTAAVDLVGGKKA